MLFFSSFGLDGDILVDKALDFCLVCGGIGRVTLGMTGALNEEQVFVGAASVIEFMHHISGDEIVLCAVDKEHRHLCVADALDRVDLFEIGRSGLPLIIITVAQPIETPCRIIWISLPKVSVMNLSHCMASRDSCEPKPIYLPSLSPCA